MHVIASTSSGAPGFRPWQARLLGDYQRAQFSVPTESYSNLPTPGAVTGGLGLDLSAIPTWAWLAAAAVGAFFFFKPRRARNPRRRRRS